VTKENYKEIPDLIDLSIQLKVPRFCLYWLVPSGRGKTLFDNKKLKTDEALKILDIFIRKLKNLAQKK